MTSALPGIRWIQRNAVGLDVAILDDSDQTAALSLQGPASREILKQVADADVHGLKFFRATAARLGGITATITRTGYTGDLGYEIWVDNGHAEALWDLLIEAGSPYGVLPTGILAMDVARIEAGLLLIDVDYISARRAFIESQKSSPFELGLHWTVSAKKGPFVGRRALMSERARESTWKLRGLEIDWDSLERLYADVGLPAALPTVAWRTSVPVYADGRQVGYATSGCWSPLLKKYIALAHLEGSHSEVGSTIEMEITVEHRRRRAAAAVVETPFFDPERKRG
jgi:aminomethyltransferase